MGSTLKGKNLLLEEQIPFAPLEANSLLLELTQTEKRGFIYKYSHAT